MEPKGYAILGGAADIHVNDDNPLRWASMNGHLDVVKCLVSHGADIHVNNEGALRWASLNGHLAVVELLIKHGANFYADDNLAIKWASNHGHTHIVKYLQDCIEKKKEIEKLQTQLLIIQNKLNELVNIK
jgi:ankyrin repeat protein